MIPYTYSFMSVLSSFDESEGRQPWGPLYSVTDYLSHESLLGWIRFAHSGPNTSMWSVCIIGAKAGYE